MLAGPTMPFLFTWIAMRLQLREEIVLCENVEDFPVSVLQSTLGQVYVISTIVVCSHGTFGLPVLRKRRYTVLTLRDSVRLTRPLADVKTLLSRRRSTEFTWKEYLTAGRYELANELAWASKRPKATGPILPIEDKDAFVNALTPEENKSRKNYLKIASNCAVSLAQRPEHRLGKSSESVLHTIVTIV